MRYARSLVVAAMSAAALGPLGGCGSSGPDMYPVSGMVTFDGEPVAEGYLTLTPDNRSLGPDAGEINDGKFAFDAKAGPKSVQIEASRFIGPENVAMGLRPKEQYIPIEYNLETTLTAEVTPDGDNVFNFDLSDPPQR